MTFKLAYVLTLTLAALPLAGCGSAGDDRPARACPAGTPAALTPYPGPAGWIQGATWAPTADPAGDLRRMRDGYGIDTVNVYGLETWSGARLEALFTALAELGMRAVVRLEAYDPATFAFRPEDAAQVLARHRELLDRARGRPVAYLALNMPVDDPRVQARLGGVNSPLSVARQVAYARTLVGLVRPHAGGAPIFLGLFYGWDGSYRVPSYRDSGADGYVLTSYSYPGARVAQAGSGPDELIDAPRLRAVADRAVAAHPGAPLIVEYGFQTLAAQNAMPDQTAGLVADVTVKRAALRATTHFYCSRYPAVIGTTYFGYNIVKAEGNPPRTLDYGLINPPGR
ncbi:hypothetical protein GCM10020358_27820 [Amorphoplanes nipponensis]|uniref:Uncharacterized protein n=1 Tax=Actinoplanes nipponensis TaxID=135950 RepID=A0A919JGS8_9ACTN|nr:hypothetical protein [Actinoplanes nipponensis]GIE46494.1 hypothetical protein Ani05nite_00280 [Actinoplanes nipponensis]